MTAGLAFGGASTLGPVPEVWFPRFHSVERRTCAIAPAPAIASHPFFRQHTCTPRFAQVAAEACFWDGYWSQVHKRFKGRGEALTGALARRSDVYTGHLVSHWNFLSGSWPEHHTRRAGSGESTTIAQRWRCGNWHAWHSWRATTWSTPALRA